MAHSIFPIDSILFPFSHIAMSSWIHRIPIPSYLFSRFHHFIAFSYLLWLHSWPHSALIPPILIAFSLILIFGCISILISILVIWLYLLILFYCIHSHLFNLFSCSILPPIVLELILFHPFLFIIILILRIILFIHSTLFYCTGDSPLFYSFIHSGRFYSLAVSITDILYFTDLFYFYFPYSILFIWHHFIYSILFSCSILLFIYLASFYSILYQRFYLFILFPIYSISFFFVFYYVWFAHVFYSHSISAFRIFRAILLYSTVPSYSSDFLFFLILFRIIHCIHSIFWFYRLHL